MRWCWVNFQCRGVLQFGYSRARAYCTRSRCGWGLFGHFYSPLSFLSSFSLSLGDGSIYTEILSQRAVKPKTTNQPTTNGHSCLCSTVGCLLAFSRLCSAASSASGSKDRCPWFDTGSRPLAFFFSFKKGSCQLLTKV